MFMRTGVDAPGGTGIPVIGYDCLDMARVLYRFQGNRNKEVEMRKYEDRKRKNITIIYIERVLLKAELHANK